MEWFNLYGLIFIAVIMIPNIVFAAIYKDGFANKYNNRTLELIEQIGRFGCIGFMIFNIPGTCFGWRSNAAFRFYLAAGALLIGSYCIIWMVCRKKNSIFRALALSIIPSVLFLLSGVMGRSVPLIISACLFAPAHILISYRNAR